MKRDLQTLVDFLYKETSFPDGCVLLTGTGVVPPDDFTLRSGDEIGITMDGIGTLRNTSRWPRSEAPGDDGGAQRLIVRQFCRAMLGYGVGFDRRARRQRRSPWPATETKKTASPGATSHRASERRRRALRWAANSSRSA